MTEDDRIQLYLKGYKEGQKEAWSEIKNLVSKYEGWDLRSRIESRIGTLNEEIESKRREVLEDPEILSPSESEVGEGPSKEEKKGIPWNKGDSYLFVEEKPERSIKDVSDVMRRGASALIITRKSPQKLIRSFDIPLEKAEFIWLSSSSNDLNKNDNISFKKNSPSDLSGLSSKIGNYLKSKPESVVFLSNISLMTNYNDNSKVFKLINYSKDRITEYDSCLVVSLASNALEKKFFERIKSEFNQIFE